MSTTSDLPLHQQINNQKAKIDRLLNRIVASKLTGCKPNELQPLYLQLEQERNTFASLQLRDLSETINKETRQEVKRLQDLNNE